LIAKREGETGRNLGIRLDNEGYLDNDVDNDNETQKNEIVKPKLTQSP
jgi:hypothetical protein